MSILASVPVTNHRQLLAPITGTITDIRHHGGCVQVRVHTGAAIDLPLEGIQDLVQVARREPRGCRLPYDSHRLLLLPATQGGCRICGPQSETTRRGRRVDTAIVVQANIGGCLVTANARAHADGTVQTRDDRFDGVEARLDSLIPEDVGRFPYIAFKGPDLEPYDWVIARVIQLRRQWNGNDFRGPFVESPQGAWASASPARDGPA